MQERSCPASSHHLLTREQGSRILFSKFLQDRLSNQILVFPLWGVALLTDPTIYFVLVTGRGRGKWVRAPLHSIVASGENVSRCDEYHS